MELRSIGPSPPKNPLIYGGVLYNTVRNLSGASGFATQIPLFPLPLMGASLKTGAVHGLRLGECRWCDRAYT